MTPKSLGLVELMSNGAAGHYAVPIQTRDGKPVPSDSSVRRWLSVWMKGLEI